MKKSILFLMGLGATMFLAAPLFADATSEVKAHVPFAFVAGKETLPAGDYDFVLDFENTPMVLGIRSKDGKSRDILLAESKSEAKPARESQLVFEQIGDTHYLSQVQVAGFDVKDVVPQTEIMREYVKTAANNPSRKRATVPLHKR